LLLERGQVDIQLARQTEDVEVASISWRLNLAARSAKGRIASQARTA
jgi:hypothetical protein